MAHKILITDDDKALCELLQSYLQTEGFIVVVCHNGNAAIEVLKEETFDLLILDVMMPGKNGFDTLTELRRFCQIPVIMLTARGDKVDRIVGLEMGADDYVPKPCDPRELVARIRAIFRRTHSPDLPKEPTIHNHLEIDDLSIHLNSRQAMVGENEIELTSTEFDFLKLLLENAGQLVPREVISQKCLGKKLQPFDRSIDMHISNIRKKLGDFGSGKPRIKTIRNSGYQYLVWTDNDKYQQ